MYVTMNKYLKSTGSGFTDQLRLKKVFGLPYLRSGYGRFVKIYADMAELADALDLGSSGRPCRFESCYPHQIMIIRTRFQSGTASDF